jgi:hypothetical protein
VLVACEFSGVVREAFEKRGHDAWSCDLLPSERPGNHILGDVLDVLEGGWDLMIAHPPCTYLTNAGVRHLYDHVQGRAGGHAAIYGEARWEAMREGADFFNALKAAPVNRIAIENPIPHRYARELIGRYDQLYQPWWFGEAERKGTCLWLKNLPPLMATLVMTERVARVHREPPSPERWKNRSRTLPGIAAAMAEQWGEA